MNITPKIMATSKQAPMAATIQGQTERDAGGVYG
jgi:hypothetical protein